MNLIIYRKNFKTSLIENIRKLKFKENENIRLNFLIDFKIRNKMTKFSQNFAIKLDNSMSTYNNKILVLKSNNLNEESLKNVLILEDTPVKEIKRSIKWILFNKKDCKNSLEIPKEKASVLLKKTIFAFNVLVQKDSEGNQIIEDIKKGFLIKCYRMNNAINLNLGKFINSDILSENICKVYEFVFSNFEKILSINISMNFGDNIKILLK